MITFVYATENIVVWIDRQHKFQFWRNTTGAAGTCAAAVCASGINAINGLGGIEARQGQSISADVVTSQNPPP